MKRTKGYVSTSKRRKRRGTALRKVDTPPTIMISEIEERLTGFISRLQDVSQRFREMDDHSEVIDSALPLFIKIDKLINILELLPDTTVDNLASPLLTTPIRQSKTTKKKRESTQATKSTMKQERMNDNHSESDDNKLGVGSDNQSLSSMDHHNEPTIADDDHHNEPTIADDDHHNEPTIANDDHHNKPTIADDHLHKGSGVDDNVNILDESNGVVVKTEPSTSFLEEIDDTAMYGEDYTIVKADVSEDEKNTEDSKDKDGSRIFFEPGMTSAPDKAVHKYLCSTCGHHFKSKSGLREHHLRERGQGRYTCRLCGQVFLVRVRYRSHLLKHIGEKEYKCAVDGCDSQYVHKKDLDAHMQSKHGDGGGAECPKCKHKFASKESLRQHMYACIKGRKYNCIFCEYNSSFKSNMNRHMKLSHGAPKD